MTNKIVTLYAGDKKYTNATSDPRREVVAQKTSLQKAGVPFETVFNTDEHGTWCTFLTNQDVVNTTIVGDTIPSLLIGGRIFKATLETNIYRLYSHK